MITKAIVEALVDRHKVRVRIPILDRVSSSNVHTKTEDLNIATICTLPSCHPNLQPGDVVFVAFEDSDQRNAVVLGHLYRQNMTDTYSDIVLNSLKVNGECTLTKDTTIGNISYTQLSTLTGIKDNIQNQLNSTNEKVDTTYHLLKEEILSLKELVKELKDEIETLKSE